MTFVIVFLWILTLGLVGCFTVGAIIMHIQKKRMDKAWAAYAHRQRLMMRYPGKYTLTHNNYDSERFEELSIMDADYELLHK